LFEALKKRFTIELILVIPYLNKKMRMEIDVLDCVIGEVLSIEYDDGQWRLVEYLLKFLNETERNYEIYDKEMLAVIRELEN